MLIDINYGINETSAFGIQFSHVMRVQLGRTIAIARVVWFGKLYALNYLLNLWFLNSCSVLTLFPLQLKLLKLDR
ncbi:hypothetical protein HanXRQr2_Chr17g0826491 [Helianthus annuus]|uniref:Uncharacterized protein n=1 Tax=Helianthus annuus TaxID=4232 RepID=A0A9K3GWD8_HELAN|nr:hypothetical protein HanXRQr2_Chr17g0826491 [Helianthus annuus]